MKSQGESPLDVLSRAASMVQGQEIGEYNRPRDGAALPHYFSVCMY